MNIDAKKFHDDLKNITGIDFDVWINQYEYGRYHIELSFVDFGFDVEKLMKYLNAIGLAFSERKTEITDERSYYHWYTSSQAHYELFKPSYYSNVDEPFKEDDNQMVVVSEEALEVHIAPMEHFITGDKCSMFQVLILDDGDENIRAVTAMLTELIDDSDLGYIIPLNEPMELIVIINLFEAVSLDELVSIWNTGIDNE